MEKAIYPSPFMRITQGFNEGTHLGSFAIDEAGSDIGIDNILAPFTGIIKKIYKSDANEIWFESIDKVEYSDGTIDYMTVLFAHDNDVENLYIGKKVNKGDILYQEGRKGNTTGNHCHIECGRGKFTGSGWYKNTYNNWVIYNGKNPIDCFYIDDSITILDNHNYIFKKVENNKTEKTNITTENISDKKLIFACLKDDMYALHLKKGQKLYLDN